MTGFEQNATDMSLTPSWSAKGADGSPMAVFKVGQCRLTL